MRARQRLWYGIVAAALSGRLAAAQTLDRRQPERFEQMLREEGQAVLALADAAASGRAERTEFAVGWHNDFFKAQAGTFVPFVLTVRRADLRVPAVLLYLRLARIADGVAAVEEIFPIEVEETADPVRIRRGFSAPPGEYDLTVVVRERERLEDRAWRPRAAVMSRPLRVPDYSRPELATSTVILADRVSVLERPPEPERLPERPYAIGTRDVQPRLTPVFRQTEELTVVFLVYHPALTAEKHFDLEVEYHFFRQGPEGVPHGGASSPALRAAETGERYFIRTEPQRFNPMVLGPQFEPGAGQPVLAGQSVPLSEFEPGDYRLAITVTDLVAGRAIARQVIFSVRP